MIRLKYYLKNAAFGLAAAAAVVMAVFCFAGGDTALRLKAADIYENISAPEPLLININTASVRELQKLNGVGEITARSIVEYRNEHGYFSSADELVNVKGIGQSTLEKLRPYLTV